MNLDGIAECQRMFPNDFACLDHVVQQRWGGSPTCEICYGTKGKIRVDRRVWACSKCGRQILVLKGTLLSGTRLPLTRWFLAIRVFLDSKGELTAKDLQLVIGAENYKTAVAWLKKLRQSAGQIFTAASERPCPMKRLRIALRSSRPAPSGVMLARKVVSRIKALRPGKLVSGHRQTACFEGWCNSPGLRRAKKASFTERLLELGFHLVLSAGRVATFLLNVRSPTSRSRRRAPKFDFRLIFAYLVPRA
ncbi:MAG: transposase [Holophagaceae bacterium]|nr:transposase [Holophagaceae bacterium]